MIERREELMVFALLQGLQGRAISTALQRLDDGTIRTFHAEIKGCFESLSRPGGQWPLNAGNMQRRFRRHGDGRISADFEGGSLIDLLRWQAGDLIAAHGQRIALCEQCRRLFLRRKRGLYCSTRCSQKVRNDRMRVKLSPAARTARNRTRREEYARELKRQLGAGVKVGRPVDGRPSQDSRHTQRPTQPSQHQKR